MKVTPKIGINPEFASILKKELAARKSRNPKYSLRAFGKALGISAAALSKILNGKHRPSVDVYFKVARELGFTQETTASMLPEFFSKALQGKSKEYQSMSIDQFKVISDWYHFAILELIHVDGFKPRTTWIAKVLGISGKTAQGAVDRLIHMGMIFINGDGKWEDRAGTVSTLSTIPFTTEAHRNLQFQILKGAMEALQTIPIQNRDQSGMTMAIDVSRLAEARDEIKRFRRKMCEFLKPEGTKRHEVFQLSVSLYPVSKVGSGI